MSFRDRTDAGQRLAAALAGYRHQHPIVLALPRGGVQVAARVAQALNAPLDLLLVRKIGVPWQPELAMGAVVDGDEPIVVRNETVIAGCSVEPAAFDAVREREMAEIERRRRLYLGDRPRAGIAGRTVIVVDDGVATGATTRAALRSVAARKPRKLVLAVPVGPADTVAALRDEVDEVVCLEMPEDFRAIGLHYGDFAQVGDEEVRRLLAQAPAPG
ncbi:MAG: phosphoribosyltransferase [Pseudomonadota bacterium]